MSLYGGIADELGVEALIKDFKPTSNHALRVRMNGQRHAFLFRIELPDDLGAVITDMVGANAKQALEVLKRLPGFEVSDTAAAKRCPFYGSDDARPETDIRRIVPDLNKRIDNAWETMSAIDRAKLKAQAMRRKVGEE